MPPAPLRHATYAPAPLRRQSYERRFFWFEAVEMWRKFFLVAGLALLERGSAAQLLLAIFVAFAYLVAFINT